MHLVIDEKLRHGIKHYPHGDQVTYGRQTAACIFPAMQAAEKHTVKIRRPPGPGIGQSAAKAEYDGDRRLENKPEPPGTGETLWQFLQKLP